MAGFAYQIVISAKVEKVWQALMDPEFTKKYWFGRCAISDWKLGSTVEIRTPEGATEVRGKVLEIVPMKRLSYTWESGTVSNEEGKATTVLFELQEMGPLVKLSILQDIDAASAGFQAAASGWTFILCGIKTLLETGNPLPAIPWKKG